MAILEALACIAAEADDLLAVIREGVEKERREKQAAAQSKEVEPIPQKIAGQQKNDNSKETSAKAAELFNTNRTYVNQVVKMKRLFPDLDRWQGLTATRFTKTRWWRFWRHWRVLPQKPTTCWR